MVSVACDVVIVWTVPRDPVALWPRGPVALWLAVRNFLVQVNDICAGSTLSAYYMFGVRFAETPQRDKRIAINDKLLLI